jgi:hypothetical protein
MQQKNIGDAPAAEGAVRNALHSQYGNKLTRLIFRKCWYASAGRQEFWDVEGSFIEKRGILGRETRGFRYQVDPDSGRILGYELITPVPKPGK